MKKLVALAVAGAFVAPVYAADVSVSGEVEFTYTTTTGADPVAATADHVIVVTASETINGIKVTGTLPIDQDANAAGTTPDGAILDFAFASGVKFGVGDQSGAMDSVGDYTDVSPALGSFAGDGGDHAFKLTLPTFSGVTAYLSHSPKTSVQGTSTDVTSYAVKYAFPNGEVYYGSEALATEDQNSYGIKYTFSGITVAYEIGNETNGASADQKETGISLTYKMGDILLGMEMQSMKLDGNAAYSNDDTILFAEYNLGSSVDIYVASTSSSLASGTDATAVGVEFAF